MSKKPMPMTDKRLAEIRDIVEQSVAIWQRSGVEPPRDVLRQVELLAEVERQRAVIAEQQAEIAAMRPIVEAVASHEGFDRYPDDIDYPATCAFCNETDDNEMTQIEHLDWCPVTQARAYVAAHPAATAVEQ